MEKQNEQRKQDLRSKVNDITTKVAVVATPLIMATGAHAADGDVDVGVLAIGGLAAGAAAIFAVKSAPSLLMWGYNQILGFLKRG
ncbi:hypothetical protein QTA56_02750 [Acinetobacter sp. VNH17]|uniref:Uncharacterized protein n=1 Tax=Acinetobacter thutiue TaxID=2998078 RepID=A0ABT7WKJ0_9GAMM|nr:hypothetical protein [Acinetobacter thutiue]MCY6411056.1 hypothetical protein [Acinetobacter thutiue]MDN0013158.1 hypothetical protein [Acinetobacter thutiue]